MKIPNLKIAYVKGRQPTARGPDPARHAKLSGPRHIN